jgi:thioredoxin reductase
MSELDVAIVGAGPAGLAAALELRRLGATVAVYEREHTPGGIPRHTRHTGYGIRDLHRIMDGPGYASRYTSLAERRQVELQLGTTVLECGTGWILATGPAGIVKREARAIVVATGCRERPRTARLIAGDRPAGVFTTGSLQQFADLWKMPVGSRAVVVGAEHVSFSAVHTLAAHGVKPLAVVTEHARAQSYLPLQLATAGLHRTHVLTGSRVLAIRGRARVEAVEVERCCTGERSQIPCDTVVFTGDWVPDNELVRAAGVEMAGRAPSVDQGGRTSLPGIFAAGNVHHAAEPADACALDGRHVAGAVARFLNGELWPSQALTIDVRSPLLWASPARLSLPLGPLARGLLLTRAGEFRDRGALELVHDGTVILRERRRRLVPNRGLALRASALPAAITGSRPLTLRWADG